MLKSQIVKGNNGLKKSKYVTFTVEADNLEQATSKLERLEIDILSNLKSMGVRAESLNGEERLKILHDVLNPNKTFEFSYKDLKKRESTKTYIVPDEFNFTPSRYFKFGKFIGATSHFQILASELSDRMLSEFLDIDDNINISFHIRAIDQSEAIKMVKRKNTDIDKMKIEENKKAVRSGYDMDILPSDLITYGEDVKSLLKDLQTRDERMFVVSIVFMNFARTVQKLDNTIAQISSIANKHNCKLKRLDHSQEQGLVSVLPLGVNKIEIDRGLTSSSTAVFMPFTTEELFINSSNSLYYGLNALSHNLIMADRKKLKNPNGLILGTPGSGKSYAVVNNFIKQQIEKGFSMYVYDFKFSDLSTIAYNHLLNHPEGYKVKPKFYVINFDDPRRSHRCNPIHPDFMEDITDAYESAYTIMLNLNKSWVQKQGDFFVESPIILFAAIIWYLKIFQNGKYCTFPHAIEFLNRRYEDIFPILTSYPELENYLSPFMDAWLGGAAEQLMGQIASAKIPLSRMISPQLYWVMSDSEFTLDINNPEEPKILCVGNNPDRQNIYGAALGLYNSRIVKLINKKGMLKSSVIIDELPTIYFKGLDNLIATARSNKVAVCLGFQDFSQLVRDYGDKEAKVVMNTVGNIFSGQVVGETAKTLSERFGKVLQKRQSISINRQDVSTSINTQMDSLIPPSKISGLTQGMFVGSVSDNFNERIEQKIFHCEIVVDAEKVRREEKAYKKIPVITDFTDGDGNDRMKETVQANYRRIKEEVKQIVQEELERIANDENLKHLLQQK